MPDVCYVMPDVIGHPVVSGTSAAASRPFTGGRIPRTPCVATLRKSSERTFRERRPLFFVMPDVCYVMPDVIGHPVVSGTRLPVGAGNDG